MADINKTWQTAFQPLRTERARLDRHSTARARAVNERRAAPAPRAGCGPHGGHVGWLAATPDVGGGPEGRVTADKAVLGGAPQDPAGERSHASSTPWAHGPLRYLAAGRASATAPA